MNHQHPIAILGIGTATPPHTISQSEAAAMACAFHDLPSGNKQIEDEQKKDDHKKDARVVQALYRRSGVKTRGSVLADADGKIQLYAAHQPAPTTAQRMELFRAHACPLAVEASKKAMQQADVDAQSITHLITVSCTGFEAPGVDYDLIMKLGLQADTRRTHIGFMGCHAAINAIAIAHALATQDSNARVLVCCFELCTLHFDHDPDAQGHVANSLFGDGAGALVIAQSKTGSKRIVSTGSTIIEQSSDLMRWSISDHGFRMRLSPMVPGVLAEHVPRWINRWLGRLGYQISDIPSWAIHPGGPRVLTTLADTLGLSPDAVQISRDVLLNHGNMSSSTLILIMEKNFEQMLKMPMVALAFGPGLAGESLLLD